MLSIKIIIKLGIFIIALLIIDCICEKKDGNFEIKNQDKIKQFNIPNEPFSFMMESLLRNIQKNYTEALNLVKAQVQLINTLESIKNNVNNFRGFRYI